MTVPTALKATAQIRGATGNHILTTDKRLGRAHPTFQNFGMSRTVECLCDRHSISMAGCVLPQQSPHHPVTHHPVTQATGHKLQP
jgi:hypothetical protein